MTRRRMMHVIACVLGLTTVLTGLMGVPARADTVTTVIAYQSPGWRYKEVAHGNQAGFEASSFDDSSWATGQAGFGTTDQRCSWNNDASVHTPWSPDTDILIRKHFAVPAGTTRIHIAGTVDNDASLYVNGILVNLVSGGFCESRNINFDVPASALGGDNVLAIRGIDRGAATYLDVEVTVDSVGTGQPKISKYVALGDSFASGEGAKDSLYLSDTRFDHPESGGTIGCHRSTKGWATQVAAFKSYTAGEWSFVACSGAVVRDLYQPNDEYVRYGASVEPPQKNAVQPTTKLATLIIGGNDVGFATVLHDCVFDQFYQGDGRPGCRHKNRVAYKTATAGLRSLRDGIPVGGGASKTLADAYFDIARSMEDGVLVVAGYPRLFGENRRHYLPGTDTGCSLGKAQGKKRGVSIPDPLYIKRDDAKWINDITDDGNDIIERSVNKANTALKKTGARSRVKYVLVDKQFHNHRLCDNKSEYFNKPIFHGLITEHPAPDQRSFHPNQKGQDAYFRAVKNAVK